MPSPIFISRPPPGFTPLAIIRGMQLTILGGYRAMRNPELAKSKYYKQAVKTIAWSMLVQLVIWSPVVALRYLLLLLNFLSRGRNREIEYWINTLKFWQSVLNVGPLLISAIRYIRPEMDEVFLTSLKFVDEVHRDKHPHSDRLYYNALVRYEKEPAMRATSPKSGTVSAQDKLGAFARRSAIRIGTTVALYALSGVPVLGRLVLPVSSFNSLNQVAGTPTAASFFLLGLVVPRRYMIRFLAAFWGGRSLARELLMPYFNRIPFSRNERDRWFSAREGIMFGFGAGFYFLLKMPFIGVLIYGFAEASSAYLVTKVSDPPPPPALLYTWTEGQTMWTRRDEAIAEDLNNDFTDPSGKPPPPPLPPRDEQPGHHHHNHHSDHLSEAPASPEYQRQGFDNSSPGAFNRSRGPYLVHPKPRPGSADGQSQSHNQSQIQSQGQGQGHAQFSGAQYSQAQYPPPSYPPPGYYQ